MPAATPHTSAKHIGSAQILAKSQYLPGTVGLTRARCNIRLSAGPHLVNCGSPLLRVAREVGGQNRHQEGVEKVEDAQLDNVPLLMLAAGVPLLVEGHCSHCQRDAVVHEDHK